ncbi:hypothetical protein Tco_0676385 [Tanacetum coccineum]
MSLMGNKRMHNQGAQELMTDYESSKLLRVQENQERLRELGVKITKKLLHMLPLLKRYANLSKQRVSASNISRVIPCADGEKNGKIVDVNVEKRNQPRARITMGELILNKKGSLRKQSELKHNSRKRNTLTISISGPRRKLFSVDDDECTKEFAQLLTLWNKKEVVYERKIVELKEDNEKKIELMRKEFINEHANLVEDTMRKILEKLPPEVACMVLT